MDDRESYPDYLAQTGECEAPDQREEWLRARTAEYQKRGCTYGRATWDVDRNLLLIEAWKEQPADDGEPRFQLTSARD